MALDAIEKGVRGVCCRPLVASGDRGLPELRSTRRLIASGAGLDVREAVLRRRAAVASAHVQHPGTKLSPRDRQELDELTARLDNRLKG